MQRDTFVLQSLNGNTPDSKRYIESKLRLYGFDADRYGREKNEIQTEVRSLEKQQEVLKHQGVRFGICVVFLQLAILLSSLGAFLKRKEPWFAGLAFGLVALIYFINGFCLYY